MFYLFVYIDWVERIRTHSRTRSDTQVLAISSIHKNRIDIVHITLRINYSRQQQQQQRRAHWALFCAQNMVLLLFRFVLLHSIVLVLCILYMIISEFDVYFGNFEWHIFQFSSLYFSDNSNGLENYIRKYAHEHDTSRANTVKHKKNIRINKNENTFTAHIK